jgi:hypothetical protein
MNALSKDLQKTLLNYKKEKNLLKAEEVRSAIDIEACIAKLTNLYERAEVCDLEDIDRLRFQASIVTTILKKALPDLKAIEISEKPNNAKKLIIDLNTTIEPIK